jgi:hypothetical protein
VSSANGENDPHCSMALLYPSYMDNVKVFNCPSQDKAAELRQSNTGGAIWKCFNTAALTAYGPTMAFGPSYGYDHKSHFRDMTPGSALAADMDGTASTNDSTVTSNHEGGQHVMYFDAHVVWKSTNYSSNDPLDNVYTAQAGWGVDTDAIIKVMSAD